MNRPSTPAALACPRRLAMLGLMLIGISACSEAPLQEPLLRPVSWTTPAAAEAGAMRRISGTLVAPNRAPLAFELPGVVDSVAVEVGDTFTAGEPLATLEGRSFRLQVAQRRAEQDEAQASLNLARQDFTRATRLLERGATSKAQYDAAASQAETARSRLATARARLDIAEEDLADTMLIAPYDGELTARHIEPAQRVQPGQTALAIQGIDTTLEIEISVPETLVSDLEVGTTQHVDLPALSATASAEVIEIGRNAQTSTAYPVKLLMRQPPQRARPGMTAEVLLQATQSSSPADRLRIPATAFATDSANSRFALVLEPRDDSYVVAKRGITISTVTGQHALVTEGLSSDDVIVERGLAFLSDGQRVTRLGDGPRRFNE